MVGELGNSGYPISAADHLERVEALLKRGDVADLLYAALELRLGTEERQDLYAQHWDHIPKKVKKSWSLSEVGRGLARAFNVGDVVAVLVQEYNDDALIESRYTPVTQRLLRICEELGNYLHARGWKREYDAGAQSSKIWREKLHTLVVEGYAHLKFSTSGNMSGPALKGSGTNHFLVIATYPDDVAQRLQAYAAVGAVCHVLVQYEPVADVIAPIHTAAGAAFPYRCDEP
jgi:hypothetical protein